jgi:hypothetical protein
VTEPAYKSEPEEVEAEPPVEEQSAEVPVYEVESFDRPAEIAKPDKVQAEIIEAASSEEAPEEVSVPEAPEPQAAESTGFAFSNDYEADVQHFEDADVVESPQFETNGSAPSEASSPEVSDVTAPTGGTRRLDLPIEVSESERGTHTKARRFARLLVSEIKLYNEEKVKQGRQAGDLYERLKEAIDRSREMYDKRVDPPVSSKFDYFHYELVQDLAEGDPNRLGSGYPGSAV